MLVCRTVSELRGWRAQQLGRVGVVPTMGYLHEGHLSLVRQIKHLCDMVVVTLFVNPTQFNNPEDLEKYPRDEERDLALLRTEGVGVVFVPGAQEMYPPGSAAWVVVDDVSEPLEGAHRPGHFRGVTTVVTKLFNVVQPDVAIFGEKDFQQLRVIEEMVQSLLMPIKMVRGELIRDADGLAMSSRNVRLSPADRVKAQSLSRGLRQARMLSESGETDVEAVRQAIVTVLQEVDGIVIDYVEIVDEETLKTATTIKPGSRACVAAWIGGVRLIDTVAL